MGGGGGDGMSCDTGKHMCINRMLGTVKAKEPKKRRCETLPVFRTLSLSTLAGELVKNICCVFCQRKMSSLAMVSK